jgi:hypothetical protein
VDISNSHYALSDCEDSEEDDTENGASGPQVTIEVN